MKLQHLLVAAILAGFLAFGILIGCSQDSPMEAGIGQANPSGDRYETAKKAKKKTPSEAAVVPYAALMSWQFEVPQAEGSEAEGRGFVTWRKNQEEFQYSVRIEGLTGTPFGSHFHFGSSGMIGPVVVPLTLTGEASGVVAAGVFTAADFTGAGEIATLADLHDAIMAGNIYINVHTPSFPGGEARGQLSEAGDPREPTRKKKVAAN